MNKLFPIVLALLFFGCDEDNPVIPEDVYGCTISTACNFNPEANVFDDSCIYGEVNFCNECGNSYNCLYGDWHYESQLNEFINAEDNQECDITQYVDYQVFGNINIYSNGTLDWSLYNICDELWSWEFDEFWQTNEEYKVLKIECGDGGIDFEISFDITNSQLKLYEGQSQMDEIGNHICSYLSEVTYVKAE